MNPNSDQKRIAFGYNRDAQNRIIINKGQAAAVKLIFQYYTEGSSIAKIKESLEKLSIPSPLNSTKWSKQTIANILSNTHYLGDEIYPTIISNEQFHVAQTLKQDNIGNNGYGKKYRKHTSQPNNPSGAAKP